MLNTNGKRLGRPRLNSPLNPAARVIKKFGGEREVADAIGVSPSAPYRWQITRKAGGTHGLIPPRFHLALIKAARRRKIKLIAADFYP